MCQAGAPRGCWQQTTGSAQCMRCHGWGDSRSHSLRPGARSFRQGRGQFVLMKRSHMAQAGVSTSPATTVSSQARHKAGDRATVHRPNLSFEIACGPLPAAGNSKDAVQHLCRKKAALSLRDGRGWAAAVTELLRDCLGQGHSCLGSPSCNTTSLTGPPL